MGKSKIVLGDGRVLMDLTADSVEASKLLKGVTAHGADGEPITGTCTFDANTSDANAKSSEILKDRTAYVNGVKVTGEMPNNGGTGGTISAVAEQYAIPQGYADGSGKVAIASTEQAKLIPENIRQGVTVLGVAGTMSGSEDVKAQTKSVTPTMDEQVVLPDTGYNYMTQVTVAGIPYKETENSAGGITVTIG